MKLFEFEGKRLFGAEGIEVPRGTVIESVQGLDGALDGVERFAVKSQLLSGKRKSSGAIGFAGSRGEAVKLVEKFLGAEFNGETVKRVLVEEMLPAENEYYLGIAYDTSNRAPNLIISRAGGIDIEETRENSPEKVLVWQVNPLKGLQQWEARQALVKAGFEGFAMVKLAAVLQRMWDVFTKFDCRLIEINPLLHTQMDDFVAADAKVELDDEALYRHPELGLPPRAISGGKQSAREAEAKKIDGNDHRGSCGSSYVDLDGDIAVIAAGGGASLTCMDSLIACGGKPANYTEHSGNPPAEKLEKLTKIVLSKPDLNGLWFVGGTANFTDIYETLKGFLNGLRGIEPRPAYPIVIRRGGPRDREAFEMLEKAKKEEGWDFHLYGSDTSMTSTAEIIVEKVEEFKKRKGAADGNIGRGKN